MFSATAETTVQQSFNAATTTKNAAKLNHTAHCNEIMHVATLQIFFFFFFFFKAAEKPAFNFSMNAGSGMPVISC